MAERTYANLPDNVLDFLSSPSGFAFAQAFVKEYHLPQEQVSGVIQLVDDLALGAVDLSSLPQVLETELGVPEGKGVEAAIRLANERLLPISGVIGNVASQINLWGGTADAKIGSVRSQISPDVFVRGVLEDLGVAFEDRILEHRLELIVLSYLHHERTLEEAVAALARPEKLGGLEMDPAESEDVLEAVKEKAGGLVFLSEPAAPEEPVSVPVASEAPAPAIRKESNVPALQRTLDAVIDSVLAEAGYTGEGDQLRRIRMVLDSRLREVRNARATREKLEAPLDQGGAGISGAALVALMEAVERASKTLHAAALPPKPPKRSASPSTPKHDPMTVQAGRMKANDIENMVAASKPPPRPVLVSPPSQTPPGRPRMDDIRAGRRLVGPVGELGGMTLVSFRRLSKDASQAQRKIEDKIALIEEQGDDKKIALVAAWRKSPLYEQYVDLNKEALVSGKNVRLILEVKAAAGELVPTMEEMHAIRALNDQLRF